MGIHNPFKKRKSKDTAAASGSAVIAPADGPQDPPLVVVAPAVRPLGPDVWSEGLSPIIDIVFLHGLTGHREKTWTADKAAEPWPKTLLAKDIPNARIITYGYDADVVHWLKPAGQNTVREHAQNLVNDLCSLRARTKTTKRPILFVAHSLGGLVCQDALVLCLNPNEEAQTKLLDAVRGIAFMGTPNAGSDYQLFASAVANIIRLSVVKSPTTQLLEVLNARSQVLANIKNGFLTMVLARPKIKIHAFVEELPVTATGYRVVTPDSAKIPAYNFSTIPANHMDMTKFSSEKDQGYDRVLGRLMGWIEEIEDPSDGIKRIPMRRRTAEEPMNEQAMSDLKLGTRKYYRYSSSGAKFIRRPDLISKITTLFSEKNQNTPSICILYGMGGQGKTALAIDYCRQAETKHIFYAIFWLNASSEEALKKDLIAIADTIKRSVDQTFSSNDERVEFALQMIESWNRPWLLVLDNYDNPDGFRDLSRYIPPSSQGSVLVTSRNSNLARLGTVLEVPPMSLAEAHDLLYDRIGGVEKYPNQEEDATRIVELLGYLPLAIDQAGAYIQRRVNFTLSKFINEYNDRKDLIWSTKPRAWDYKEVVYTTWEMSFQLIDDLEEARSEKGKLLTMLSFLDFRSISQEIFNIPRDLSLLSAFSTVNGIVSPKWLQNLLAQNGDWDKFKLEDLFHDFRDLSLLQLSGLSAGILRLSMHPLVSEWIKYRSDIDTKRECLLQAIITVNICLRARLLTLERHLLSDDAEQQFIRHKLSCVQNLEEIQRRDSTFLRDLQPFDESIDPKNGDEVLRTIQNDTSKVSTQVQLLLDSEDLQYDRAILEWLAPNNMETFITNLNMVVAGSGEWFVNHEVFKQWVDGEENWLWCFGSPGSGKTVLATLAAQYLFQRKTLVVLVYCSFRDIDEQPIGVIKRLLREVLEHNIPIPDQVRSLFHRSQSLNVFPSLLEIEAVFYNLLQSRREAVYIIIDGLDELQKGRGKLLEVLRNLCAANGQYVRVMVTSRPNPDIVAFVKSFSPPMLTININSKGTSEDIRSYVRKRLTIDLKDLEFNSSDSSWRLEIEEIIVRKSQGLFIWVKLFLDQLSTLKTLGEIREASLGVSVGTTDNMGDIYQKTFAHISNQPPRVVDVSHRLLALLAFSARLLSRREVQHALVALEIKAQDIEFHQEQLLELDQMKNLCDSFVIVNDKNDSVHLVHFTAKEWLRSKSPLLQIFPFPQTRLLHACLSYLSLEPFASGPSSQATLQDRVLEYPFALYAAEFWLMHAKASDPFLDYRQIVEFLKSRTKYNSWIQILEYIERSKPIIDVVDDVNDVLTPLSARLAACQTISEILKVLELDEIFNGIEWKE